MNLALLASLTVVTSAATAYGAVQLTRGADDAAAASADRAVVAPTEDAGLDALREEVARLEERVVALGAPLAAERRRPALEVDLEALVRRVVAEERSAALEAEGYVAKEDALDPALAEIVADPFRAYREILAAGLDSELSDSIWRAAAEAGTLDDLLQLFRDEVEANPESVQANYDLAKAALDAAQTNPNHPEGVWWRESDGSFARVLELDPDHSDARYEKALNLCFWPDAFGRQPEAVRHFERLLDEGANLSGERHLQSYLWLGNLYAQNGRLEDAAGVWRRGLATYPESESLLAKLDDLEGQ